MPWLAACDYGYLIIDWLIVLHKKRAANGNPFHIFWNLKLHHSAHSTHVWAVAMTFFVFLNVANYTLRS